MVTSPTETEGFLDGFSDGYEPFGGATRIAGPSVATAPLVPDTKEEEGTISSVRSVSFFVVHLLSLCSETFPPPNQGLTSAYFRPMLTFGGEQKRPFTRGTSPVGAPFREASVVGGQTVAAR
jgi:hypothetical protein